MLINWVKNNKLKAVVFLTGGCVLVVEVVATRILAPFFGTTIFTVSSVIGVVLAALSVGYYLGGRIADKYTKEEYLFNIIILSGLSVLALQLLLAFLLPMSVNFFSMVSGPPVFSVLLFFGPALLLGMVSPYAVALQHKSQPEEGAGTVAGSIFFWGTAGSIVGTFLTGFYLIPHYGLRLIVTGVALLLLGIGLLGNSQRLFSSRKRTTNFVVMAVMVGMSLWVIQQGRWSDKVVYMIDGLYDRITITDTIYEGRLARILWQDATAESAILLPDGETAFGFNKYFELYKLTRPELNKALVIGGGAMIVPKMLLENDPAVRVDVAEIEPRLFGLARRYFQVPDSERLRVVIEDGRRYLHKSPGEYDLIYLDAYRGWNVPPHLATFEFLQLARDKTSANGVMEANLIGNVGVEETTYATAQIATWRKVWPNSYFFAAVDPDTKDIQNIAAVGFKTSKRVEIAEPENLMPGSILSSLPAQLIEGLEEPSENTVIFTDDYAPVEWLLARDLRRFGGR